MEQKCTTSLHVKDKCHTTDPKLTTNVKYDALNVHALEVAYSTNLFIVAGSQVPICNETKKLV